jgi:hypothetical protein
MQKVFFVTPSAPIARETSSSSSSGVGGEGGNNVDDDDEQDEEEEGVALQPVSGTSTFVYNVRSCFANWSYSSRFASSANDML